MGPSALSGQHFAVPSICRSPSAGEGSVALIRPVLPEGPVVGGKGRGVHWYGPSWGSAAVGRAPPP